MRGRTRRSNVDASMVSVVNERLGGGVVVSCSRGLAADDVYLRREKSALKMDPSVDGKRLSFVGTHRLARRVAGRIRESERVTRVGGCCANPATLGQETTSAAFP